MAYQLPLGSQLSVGSEGELLAGSFHRLAQLLGSSALLQGLLRARGASCDCCSYGLDSGFHRFVAFGSQVLRPWGFSGEVRTGAPGEMSEESGKGAAVWAGECAGCGAGASMSGGSLGG